ncbi:hypothetical protein H0H87_000027 [Tephrocybe sp. NHM501043]|nr:hypothetical protein H0H87_000027 [Tephrocybe sp. NHM501043]
MSDLVRGHPQEEVEDMFLISAKLMLRASLHRLSRTTALHKHLVAVCPQSRRYSDENVKRILGSSKVLRFTKRAIKYSAIASLGLAITALIGFEATHLWIEKVELAPEQDPEVKRWEWDQEAEQWSGNSVKGGTDPALGHHGKHRVRAAWAAYNWGHGDEAAVVDADATSAHDEGQPRSLQLVDAKMKMAESFMRGALRVADECPNAHPETITQLIARNATILERLGGESLYQAKTEFERAWAGFSGQGLDAAHIALRIGEISSQLGQSNDVLAWWSRAITLANGTIPDELEKLPAVLKTAPSSPRAQRILSTTLVSLSAFYAKTGNLNQAQALEEATLTMLRSVPPPASLASASAPQALHALYLLHRSSLISIHLAEVLYARKQPHTQSIQYLTSAADSSERVARALTGNTPPMSEASTTTTSATPPQETAPIPAYTSSRSMKKPANALLRDARRTSAEAWNLIGILNETQGKDLPAALWCYERAVQWAGTAVEGSMQPREGILHSEWVVIWDNYTRAKRIMDATAS